MNAEKVKRARRHHILPRFYLKRFAEQGLVWVLDFHDETFKQIPPKEAVCIKDFYTVKKINGNEDDLIEHKLLAPIEEKAAPVIAKILDDMYMPTGKKWIYLANFLSLMYVRGPGFRQFMLEMYEHSANEIVRVLHSSEDIYNKSMARFEEDTGKQINMSYEQALKLRDNCEVTCNIPRTFYVKEMLRIASRLYPVFHKMVPVVQFVNPANKARLVTSDYPFVHISNNPDFVVRGGLLDPCVKVYFPLSPLACVVLKHLETAEISAISEKEVALVNGMQSHNCSRMLVSQKEEFPWLRKDKSVSWGADELLQLLATSKKTKPKARILTRRKQPKARPSWKLLRAKDPKGEDSKIPTSAGG